MKGTRTSGTGYDRYPMGSLILKRLLRTLTQDIRYGGRHMSFLPTPRNSEQNYHYMEMNWNEKALTKFIEYNLQKKIDCDLTRLNSLISEAGKWAEQQIRGSIGAESKFKKKWKKNFQNLEEAKWNGYLTHEQNFNNATAALAEFNNTQLSSPDVEDDEEDEQESETIDNHNENNEESVGEEDDEEDELLSQENQDQDEIEDDEEDELLSQEAEVDEEEAEVDMEEDEVDMEEDYGEDNSMDQQQYPEFNPEENSPHRIIRITTNASIGTNLNNTFQNLDSIESSTTGNDEKTALAKSELKKIMKDIWEHLASMGVNIELINCQQIYTSDIYSVQNWIDEIKTLLNKKYNGNEANIYPGTAISNLAIMLQRED